MSGRFETEARWSREGSSSREESMKAGRPSTFTCPDCFGPIFEMKDGAMTRYRCQIGHSYGPLSMLDGKLDLLERVMATVLNQTEELTGLVGELAQKAGRNGIDVDRRSLDSVGRQSRRLRESMRRMLLNFEPRPVAVSPPGRDRPRSRRKRR